VCHCDERTRGLGPELLEVRLERVEGQERVWGLGGYGVRAFAGGKAREVKSRILQGRIPPLWTHLNDFCPVVSVKTKEVSFCTEFSSFNAEHSHLEPPESTRADQDLIKTLQSQRCSLRHHL
jgi:hypothetical protein